MLHPNALTDYLHRTENAALPHGSGTDRVLGKHDFVLIDTGGGLHGYQSDVTRVSVAIGISRWGYVVIDRSRRHSLLEIQPFL